ncbi:MAG: membrane protein insertase YidC [Planctomycetota bacterium]
MDRKTLIAMIACGVIMILYYPFIMPLLSPKKTVLSEAAKEEIPYQSTEIEERGQVAVFSPQPIQPQKDIPLQEVVLENELVKMVLTNEGAGLKSITLKQFKDEYAKDILALLKDGVTEYHPLAIDTILQKSNFRKQRYTVAKLADNKVAFTTQVEEGLSLVKTFSLLPGRYDVSMDVRIENNTETEISLSYNIIASSMIAHEGIPSSDMAAVVARDMGNKSIKLVQIATKKFPTVEESTRIVWAGAINKFFAAILKPTSNDLVASVNAQAFDAQGVLSNEKADLGDFMVTIQTQKLRLPSHGVANHNYIYYTGPKKEEYLKQYDTLGALLSYGWFHIISKALLAFLNTVHHAIPNYGISIIILTIVIKAVLFPLTRKSQMSMFRMQQLQPLVSQLKEKYKHDKQKLGKEQVLLFKKYGVNPMGGCLPMFLQLPVFFALFRTLQISFEMRQAPFCLWITDLSRPDTLLHFSFSLPLLGNALNILPLIMTAASYAQTRVTPKAPAADPQAQAQQKMMSFMPVMFAFILYSMPSGLTIYWTTSTLLSILETLLIRKTLKKVRIG